MLTFEKVLEVFKEYLDEDNGYEVVNTSRGYTVMVQDNRQKEWDSSQIAPSPEALRDILLDNYESYLIYKMTDECKRDNLTDREREEIGAMRRNLLERCQQSLWDVYNWLNGEAIGNTCLQVLLTLFLLSFSHKKGKFVAYPPFPRRDILVLLA